LLQKKSRLDGKTSASAQQSAISNRNKYLSTPVQPEKALHLFLTQVRNSARNYLPKETLQEAGGVIATPFCEVEMRLGLLQVPHAVPARRVTSSGAKHVNHAVVQAFDCTRAEPRCTMESGVSRSHFLRWTASGLSEVGPIALALAVSGSSPREGVEALRRGDVVETERVETVYAGYSGDRRVCFDGYHDHLANAPPSSAAGKMEYKEKVRVHCKRLPRTPHRVLRAPESLILILFRFSGCDAAPSHGPDDPCCVLRSSHSVGQREGGR
jgi:hypothetical protein